EKESKLHQSALLQAKYTRNWILGGVVLLLVIMGLMVYSSRMKQRINKKLEIQQKEISKQNMSLRHLLNEKDWLMKEIHHRVKNNFHTVISLLGTQSIYLKNEMAKSAIADSQRRVHCMSLIHQKLYQTDNLSMINVRDYIHELIDYLSNSFSISNNIRFTLQIDPLTLDISHCIPIGLILNEAITNSFKYAFPNKKDGTIHISFKNRAKNHLLLTISDNGIGLPTAFNIKKSDSMGMNLMQGLSEDIGGKFIITSQIGTQIKIAFAYDPEVIISITKKKIK
ncbi:MAG TPA: histidine kinase dimerization/phosphoacceptor domain -containing protein, partial [Flavisolibacter sp.]|nr:histidine kinase dimerization/phosphoacceptor domain -containing protein [Flavisolibacter sp.]